MNYFHDYVFYNKNTKTYHRHIKWYMYKRNDNSIKDALSNGDTIIIKMRKGGTINKLFDKTDISNEDSELNSNSILTNEEWHRPSGLLPLPRNRTGASSASSASINDSAPANQTAQNNVSDFIYEKIDTLEKLEELLEFVETFNFGEDVNINKPLRKSLQTAEVFTNLKFVIKARILILDKNKFPEIEKTKNFVIRMHGNYIPFVIKDTSGNIISVGAAHEIPVTIDGKKYLELHLILAVPGSNKGTGKKSMKLLFDTLPPEYSGIVLKPLKGVEKFYINLGYIYYRGGYYYMTKPV